jgi:hypothetical protein
VVTRNYDYEYDEASGRHIPKLLPMRLEQTFDPRGHLTLTRLYRNGELAISVEHDRDELGLSRKSTTTHEGRVSVVEKDRDEAIASLVANRPFGNTIAEGVVTYDARGCRKVENFKATPSDPGHVRYDLVNSENCLLTERRTSIDGELSFVSRYDYEFDQYKNWIRQEDTTRNMRSPRSEFRPDGYDTREIEYY